VASDDQFFANNAEKENLKTSCSPEVLCIVKGYCGASLF